MMDLSCSEGKWTVSEAWNKDAHDKEILKCFFSPDNSKLLTCCSSEHKVGETPYQFSYLPIKWKNECPAL